MIRRLNPSPRHQFLAIVRFHMGNPGLVVANSMKGPDMKSSTGDRTEAEKPTHIMMQELKLIEENIPANNCASRRVLIRSIFSSLEILLSDISAVLVKEMAPPEESAPHEEKHRYFLELCALSDISYEIRQNGVLAIKSPRIRFENRVMFVLQLVDRTFGRGTKPSEIEGREEFLNAIKIRNRVTHPKTREDLQVSQEDYDTAVRGLQWFVSNHHRACGGSEY